MTLHKLNPETAPKAAPPLDIGVMLTRKEYSFVNTRVRALERQH